MLYIEKIRMNYTKESYRVESEHKKENRVYTLDFSRQINILKTIVDIARIMFGTVDLSKYEDIIRITEDKIY